jgi:hypothetical protein
MQNQKVTFQNTPYGEILLYYLPTDIFAWTICLLCVIISFPPIIAGVVLVGYQERTTVAFQVGVAVLIIGLIVGILIIFAGIIFGLVLNNKRQSYLASMEVTNE